MAVFAVADAIREERREAIRALHERGIEVAMLTGDAQAVADAVATELGIDTVFAQILPEDKASKVRELQCTSDPAFPEQNVVNGLGYRWNPDFAALGNFKSWPAAAGQIFFSLSVGFGGMITLTAALVFLGLSGTAAAVAAVATGSFGLGFNTLPVVFAQMGAFENIIGALWFFMAWLAAITSSLSMYAPLWCFKKVLETPADEKSPTGFGP